MSLPYPGINIQWPISQLILSGRKSVETRTYPLPPIYVGKKLLLIETPGEEGTFKARISGLIVFSKSFQYENATEFYQDMHRHQVNRRSVWKWTDDKPKWGWPIEFVKEFKHKVQAPSPRGIRFCRAIEVDLDSM